MEFDDFDFYNSRRQILEGMALNSFEFSKLILGYLYEFDKWDIVGNEEVNGRSCVHIKGKLSTKAIFYELAKDYDMYVDEATGAIVSQRRILLLRMTQSLWSCLISPAMTYRR